MYNRTATGNTGRLICQDQRNAEKYSFAPVSKKEKTEVLVMTIDEYEAVRLIDLEGMSQEECAQSMNVSRTTAQSIYNNARYKLALCLIKGYELHIEGGDYIFCEEKARRCVSCHKKCGVNN